MNMTVLSRTRLLLASTLLVLVLLGCTNQPASTALPVVNAPEAPETLPEGAGVRVLFLGNSLTYYHDLPALVQALAAAGGVQLRWLASTVPNANLEDQWNNSRARNLLARNQWDFVVMQQGPSSLPESQADIKKWSVIWADAIRKRGAQPALYMVWPYQGQRNGFKLVAQSYRNAATASKALVFPAGEAWEESLRMDGSLALYDPDRLHPTPAGSYLAALIVTHGLTGVEPEKAPARLRLASGKVFELPDARAATLRQAAAKVVARNKAMDAPK